MTILCPMSVNSIFFQSSVSFTNKVGMSSWSDSCFPIAASSNIAIQLSSN